MLLPFGWTSPVAVRTALGLTFILLGQAPQVAAQATSAPITAASHEGQIVSPAPSEGEMSLLATMAESLFGDVYAEGRWRRLTLGTFFTEGWLEPWAAP